MVDRRAAIKIFGGVGVSVTAGCVSLDPSNGDEYSIGNEDTQQPGANEQEEPDELPSTLTEDGIQVGQIDEFVTDFLRNTDYSYAGIISLLSNSDVEEAFGRLVSLDHSIEKAIEAEGTDDEYIDVPEEADNIDIAYYADGTTYSTQDLESYLVSDGDLQDVIDRSVGVDLDYVVRELQKVVFDEPSWDTDDGLYVVDGVRVDEQGYSLQHLQLRITADGFPVGLEARWQEGDYLFEADIELFELTGEIDEPDWIAAGEEINPEDIVDITDVSIVEQELTVGDTLEVRVEMENTGEDFIEYGLSLTVDDEVVKELEAPLNAQARTMITVEWEVEGEGSFIISVNDVTGGEVVVN